jgi:uncharacterized protein
MTTKLLMGLVVALLTLVERSYLLPPRTIQGLFTITSGRDTVLLEQYRSNGGIWQIELVNRKTLQRSVIRAILDYKRDSIELKLQTYSLGAPASAPPFKTVTVASARNRTVLTIRDSGGSSSAHQFPSGFALPPCLDGSLVLIQESLRYAHRVGRDTLAFLWISSSGPHANVARMTFRKDTAEIHAKGLEMHLAIDRSGRITAGIGTDPGRFRIDHTSRPFKPRNDDPVPDYSVQPEAAYTGKEVRIRTLDGYSLAGTLTLPKSGKFKVPAVVLVSGSGAQDRDLADAADPRGYRGFRDLADTLSQLGIAVLRMDDRGVGASSGDANSSTAEQYASDIERAIVFLREYPRIDNHRIGLIGHSEGGSVAAMIAADDPTIRGIVLLGSPARTGREVVLEETRWRTAHDTSLSERDRDSAFAARVADYDIDSAAARLRKTVIADLKASLTQVMPPAQVDSAVALALRKTDFASLAVPAPLRFFLQYDPKPTASKVRTPVMLLHGMTDRQVSPEQAEELASAFRSNGNADVSVRLFPDLNHLFLKDSIGDPLNYRRLSSQRLAPEVRGAIADWLVDRLDMHRQSQSRRDERSKYPKARRVHITSVSNMLHLSRARSGNS